jgi:hypothetical protein
MRFGKRFGLVLVVAGVILFLCSRPQPAVLGHVTERFDFGRAELPYLGVPSCSARTCHGADSPAPDGRLLRDEYTRWIEADPHAQAYNVLFDERSARIIKNLAQAGNAVRAANEDTRCLACHCDPLVASQPALIGRRVDGVGCETCHGTARSWVEPHTAADSWTRLPADGKKRLGMADVKDTAALARTCVGCHVGAPADSATRTGLRDVNHDLIAAGHPRLDFEFATFMANLPPHWKQAADGPEWERRFGAEAWRIGQLTSARAALTLLRDRISRASAPEHNGVWPEFAEYDCAGCHHALTTPSARQRGPSASRLPGRNSWSAWYRAMPERLLAQGSEDAKAFATLANLLEQPFPSLTAARELVAGALTSLDRIEAGTSRVPDQKLTADLLERLGRLTPARDPCSWELAEQMSLTAAWLKRARTHATAPGALSDKTPALQAVFGKLAFPKGEDERANFYWDEEFGGQFKALLNFDAQPR